MKASTVSVGGAGGSTRRRSRNSAHAIRISMYSNPPDIELTLDDFEAFAVDRLRVLRGIERLRTQDYEKKQENDKITEFLNEHLQWRFDEDFFDLDMRKDHVSHFILRLAYCTSEDQRRWFLQHESALFKHRLQQLSSEEVARFTKANGLDFEVVSADEKARVAQQLQTVGLINASGATGSAGGGGAGGGGGGGGLMGGVVGFDSTTYYKIPFTQALDLVSKRQVYLEGGFAFVPGTNLISIIVNRFRTSLSKSLLQASASFPLVSQDPRLAPLLNGVHKQYVGTDYASKKGAPAGVVTPETLDAVAKRSMPLCMMKLHGALKRDHKLKHQGRQQYWLFLKGAGLSMDDSIRFFQAEFSKIMSVENFNKEHLYNIRHAYGKEGKRTNYSPYSCMKIVMGSPPGQGEAHGCPYRHSNEASLTQMLGQVNITGANKDGILAHVRKSNFQVACQKHFELTHPGAYGKGISTDGVGNHPNAWTQASLEFHQTGTTDSSSSSSSAAASPSSSSAADGGSGVFNAPASSPSAAAAAVAATAGGE